MTVTLDYQAATGDARVEQCAPCFAYASPSSPPLPIERQRHGTVDTRAHVSACYATIAAQVRRYQLVHKAYDHWQSIEAKSPTDRTPGEEYFVSELRQMECKYGWLRGQPPDTDCAAWVELRMQELVSGVPPPNWLEHKQARAKAVKEAMLAENRRARLQARAAKPSSPIAKPAASAINAPPAPKAVRKLSRYPPRTAGAAVRVTDVALKVASASIAGAAR